jgi:hypothetical protein
MWGTAAQYGSLSPTFNTPVTLSLYNVGSSSTVAGSVGPDTVYTLGSLIETTTNPDATIAYRPPADTTPGDGEFTCTNGIGSYNNSGNQQCGTISLVNFALNTALPSQFIYVVSYATDGLGNPQVNPADSLNYDLVPIGTSPLNEPTTGSNPQPDTSYYVASCSSLLMDSTCGTPLAVGNNISDPGWGSLGQANIDIIAGSPEPATFGLIGFGLVGLGFLARKKKNS